MFFRTVLLALLLSACASAHAGVYRCKDASGQTVMTDKPCAGAQNLEHAKPQQSGNGKYSFLDPATGDPELIAEVARRRVFYMRQGMPPDEALDRAVNELVPAMPPPRPKTGQDNMREYLELRERDRNALERQGQSGSSYSGTDKSREPPSLCEQRRDEELSVYGHTTINCANTRY